MAWRIAPAPVDSSAAVAVLRAYLTDIMSRYYGRPATDAEIDEAVVGAPGDCLVPPHGVFLLARDDEGPVIGCAGVRSLSDKVAELRRIWTHPDTRGRGLGSALIEAAEQAATGLGATTVRLDTRNDLVEAQRLYARHGYVEIAPYHDDMYADLFFEKRLD